MFYVKENVKTLSHLKMQQRFFARNGHPGAGRRKDGARGADTVIEVPPGTVVMDAESDEQLLDLTEPGERIVLYKGGRGGKGNTRFKSSRVQTPRFAQPGEEGVEKRLRVELRIIADIGFAGLPNAGKSTLLKVLTATNPKIGNYPFTTVIPNLGVMRHHEHDIVLADIPGIVEGAHTGAGLGIRFLKHVARTRGLVCVVDVGDIDPEESLATLRREIAAFSAALDAKPYIVVFTKMDRVENGEIESERVPALDPGDNERFPTSAPLFVTGVSAMTGTGLSDLKDALVNLANLPPESG